MGMDDGEKSQGSTRPSRASTDRFLGGMAAASGERFDADETAATAFVELETENAQLKHGLGTRAVIGQATGLLMGRDALTADEAFAVLVDQSSRRNVKLHEIAAEIVRAAEGGAASAREAK
jgi:PIN domain nuclease of toxin-antitoxin system